MINSMLAKGSKLKEKKRNTKSLFLYRFVLSVSLVYGQINAIQNKYFLSNILIRYLYSRILKNLPLVIRR